MPLRKLSLSLMLVSALAACGGSAAPAAPAAAGQAPSGQVKTIKFGYLDDSSWDAALYAIRNGKVTSNSIKLETTATDIPTLIQATGTKQYDVIMTSNLALPALGAQGVKLKILSVALRGTDEGGDIVVKSDSPIKTPADLKGKELALEGIGGSGNRIVLSMVFKKYGLSINTKNGDIKFDDVPFSSMLALLQQNKADAVIPAHVAMWKALDDPSFRVIYRAVPDFKAATGGNAVSAVLAGYDDKLAADPASYKEFNRVLKASVDYVGTHLDEVSAAVGKKDNVPPEYLKWWFTKYSTIPATIDDADLKGIQGLWQLSKEAGLMQSFPDVKTLVWDQGQAK